MRAQMCAGLYLACMPIAKNPYLRYRILNSCFTNRQKHHWTFAELIEQLAKHDIVVDRRTVERDFEAMRHDERLAYHAPIRYDKKEKAFHYADAAFSIDAVPLTPDDLEALTLATNILHQYKNVKLVQQFDGVVDKLNKAVAHLRQPQNNKLIAFEHAPYYKGREFFDVVLKAITEQRPLCITYRKFRGTQNDEHVLHPYFLKEYHGRWYVLGYGETRQNIITLGLDRFVAVKPAAVFFKENKTLKPKQYFEHTLGITLGPGPVEDIELWFSPLLAPYLKTQHLHHTQKTVREDENGLVISLKLIPNPELTQLILSYGADVKVLKPLTLQEHIKKVWVKAVGD
jgi:predicted DNA-binding transcriptional regulator YafY